MDEKVLVLQLSEYFLFRTAVEVLNISFQSPHYSNTYIISSCTTFYTTLNSITMHFYSISKYLMLNIPSSLKQTQIKGHQAKWRTDKTCTQVSIKSLMMSYLQI